MKTGNKPNVVDTIRESIAAESQRSAWDKGVTLYALELLEELKASIDGGYINPEDMTSPKLLEKALLNGASDWAQYSWGGCALIYDESIAERLCTPSELKKTKSGERRPNRNEEWLDVQSRALYQACNRVKRHVRKVLAQ